MPRNKKKRSKKAKSVDPGELRRLILEQRADAANDRLRMGHARTVRTAKGWRTKVT